MKNWDLREAVTLMAVAAGFILYGCFLFYSNIGLNPFVLFGAIIFVLFPFRRESYIVRRLLTLTVLTFAIWIFNEIVILLIPFIIAIIVAYVLDPLVTYFQRRRNIPRPLLAGVIVLTFVGLVAALSIIVFPSVYSQLNTISREVQNVVSGVNEFLESNKFYRFMETFGVEEATLRKVIEMEINPSLEAVTETVVTAIVSFFVSLSGLVTQVINIILVPILLFYALRDFDRIKSLIKRLLNGKNARLLNDLYRINRLLKAYVGGQALAALLVGLSASIVFTIMGIPYGIVLGILAGLLNPVPYIGIFLSIVVGILMLLLTGSDSLLFDTSVITFTIIVLHFLDNYFLQPRIVGARVGLHPILLIASLFIFGYFFGIIGLLLAVPTTATLVMFFEDWLDGVTGNGKPLVTLETVKKPGKQ